MQEIYDDIYYRNLKENTPIDSLMLFNEIRTALVTLRDR